MRSSCFTVSRILLWASALTPLAGINRLRAEEGLPVLSASPVRVVEGASGTRAVLVPFYLPPAAAAAPVGAAAA